MLNKLFLMGNLTADPEPATTQSGVPYCRFTLANDRPKRKDGKESGADFFNCTAWNNLANIICKYYHKGDLMTCVGEVRTSTYTKNDEKRVSTSVIVKEIHFTGGNKKPAADLPDDLDFSYNPEDFEEIAAEDVPF